MSFDPMRHRHVLIVALVLLPMLLAVACGATPTLTPVPRPPTPILSSASPTPAPPLPTAAPAPVATKPATAPTVAVPAPMTALPMPTATLPPPAAAVSFAKDILPIMQKSCTRCHSRSSPRAGLNLSDYQGTMKGGNNPPSVIPGDPDKSPLYTLVKSGVMPFGSAKLPDAEIQKIYDWIKAGAPNN